VFIHFSLLLIIFKKKDKNFPQEIFDNIFLNIEYHIRELGYGDVTVNKKMKILTRVFYDILLKINKSKTDTFETNIQILKTNFDTNDENTSILIDNLSLYFNVFYNFCFELKTDNMLKGQINFKYKY
jgi:cytochrome b pre-mRNA-processing protein 3